MFILGKVVVCGKAHHSVHGIKKGKLLKGNEGDRVGHETYSSSHGITLQQVAISWPAPTS
jgi:hypothetical protein